MNQFYAKGRTLTFVLSVIGLLCLSAGQANCQPTEDGVPSFQISGQFDSRGQYGDIPAQTSVLERDYGWWQPGHVGFWQYHLWLSGEAAISDRITARLSLTSRSPNADRDFITWGNEVKVAARLQEASLRLDRLWTNRLSLTAGRQRVYYPLFTLYDYVGGKLTARASPSVTLEWGQWQVFEGRNVDPAGQSSDDVDLWGPQAFYAAGRLSAGAYALIHSKAGGSDGISNNIRILGFAASLGELRHASIKVAGVYQHGNSSAPVTGGKKVRAWALNGGVDYRFRDGIAAGIEYWQGSGDKPTSIGVNESFQQFGYRNTLQKSTVFYRPGLSNMKMIRLMAGADRGAFQFKLHLARVGETFPARWIGTETGFGIGYAYSPRTTVRWRYGITFNGDRMQVFELSSGFSGRLVD